MGERSHGILRFFFFFFFLIQGLSLAGPVKVEQVGWTEALVIPLSLTPQCCDYRHAMVQQLYMGLEAQAQIVMFARHFSN